MKPTKYILILLSLFLTFSCDDKEEELPNELSLDWILLKRGVDESYVVNCCYSDWIISNYNINCCENSNGCDDYNEWDCNVLVMTFDTTITYKVKPKTTTLKESCSGYELCNMEMVYSNFYGEYLSPSSQNDCCYEGELPTMDSLGNIIENPYWYIEYLSYEYKLYWNDDLSVCNGSYYWDCEYDNYDIEIPYHIKRNHHPNYPPLPLDTTMMIDSKNISFEKMGWLDRESDNSLGYITYLRNEEYLQTDGDDIDISSYKIVDYQIKEY